MSQSSYLGGTSPWTDIGGMLDTLNHGTLNMPVAPYTPACTTPYNCDAYYNKTSKLGGHSLNSSWTLDPDPRSRGSIHRLWDSL
jgi:hypothetical protein